MMSPSGLYNCPHFVIASLSTSYESEKDKSLYEPDNSIVCSVVIFKLGFPPS